MSVMDRRNMDSYIELLRRLIGLKTITANVNAVNRAQDTLRVFLSEHGITCTMEELDGRKILYGSTVPGKTPDLLLNAHVDVVPAENDSQFCPVTEGDWIVGRGSGDCLGNAVCAVKTLCEADDDVSIGVIFSADEETGGRTTGRMVSLGYAARRLVCVLDNYDDDNICFAQKGIMYLKLSTRGVSGHSSTPWLFDNPVDKLITGYARLLEKWQNPTAEDSWHASIAGTMLHAGIIANQIPDAAEMSVNVRYTRPEEKEEIINFIRETTGAEVEYVSGRAPLAVRSDAKELELLAGVMEKYLGKRPGLTRMHGATDASYFASGSAPVAIIGIKFIGAHAKSERASLSSLEKYSLVLGDLAKALKQS